MITFVEDSFNNEDVPWVNEYRPITQENGQVFMSPVRRFIIGSKGVLVICNDYKGFLFNRSKIVEFLLEAKKEWEKGRTSCPGIFFTCESKPRLAFDKEIKGCEAYVSGKEIQISWKDSGKQSGTATKNPFF